MRWHTFSLSEDATHHVGDGAPVYAQRFDEVLKFHEPGLAPARRDGAAWHIRPDGSPAYDRRFRRTFGFYEGLAAVVDEDGWHHIAPSGDDAYPQRYAWCGNFQGGRCTVRLVDGHYLHLTPEGRPAYEQRWHYAGDFRDGIAVVQAIDGRSTHVDVNGELLHGRWFVDLDVYHKSFARARDEAGWMHVDHAGQPTYLRRFAAVEPFYNGQARVERFDDGLEVIDPCGSSLVELRPARRSELSTLSGDLVGFWRTQTIATAVELGIFDALPGTTAALAEACGLHVDRTRRLLRGLGELRLVVDEDARWLTTPRGELLKSGHPMTLGHASLEYAGPFTEMWSTLSDAMRADTTWLAPRIFEDLARDGVRSAAHHGMLRSYARHDYPHVPTALGLEGTELVVDAGGGLGALGHLLLDHCPSLSVVVLDRPEVVAHGISAQPERRGLEWRAADLFEPWPVVADAVVLARVLHDWNNEDAVKVLRGARQALRPEGRLFVVEMVLSEQHFGGALCDLHLLVATGGQERSEAEYRRLFSLAGFLLSDVRELTALPSVLVGVPQ